MLFFKSIVINNNSFKFADFKNVTFKDVCFKLTNLKIAGFENVNFKDVDFKLCNLVGGRFKKVTFKDVGFKLSDLKLADFKYVDFEGADFELVNFELIDYRFIIGNDEEIRNIINPFFNIIYTKNDIVIGRNQYSIEDWKSFLDCSIPEIDSVILDFWRKNNKYILNYIEKNPAV